MEAALFLYANGSKRTVGGNLLVTTALISHAAERALEQPVVAIGLHGFPDAGLDRHLRHEAK